jgi:WD40 repeat protein
MRGHKQSISAYALFKDGRRVITATKNGTLQIWDLQNGALLGESPNSKEHQIYCASSIAISPDERRIANGGYDAVIIWDVKSNQMAFEQVVKHPSQLVCSVCFSPDGKRLAGGSSDGIVIVWDVETATVLATLKDIDHPRAMHAVAFSPDGLKLASGSIISVRVWRIDNSELLLEINSWARNVTWSPDGQQLVAFSSDNKVLNVWNSLNGDQIDQLCTSHTHSIDSMTISSDGSSITTSSDDRIVQLWTRTTEEQVFEPTTGVGSVAMSSNGELSVSGDDRGKVWLQSIKDILELGKEERVMEGEEAQRQQLLFRSDTQVCSNPLFYHGT